MSFTIIFTKIPKFIEDNNVTPTILESIFSIYGAVSVAKLRSTKTTRDYSVTFSSPQSAKQFANDINLGLFKINNIAFKIPDSIIQELNQLTGNNNPPLPANRKLFPVKEYKKHYHEDFDDSSDEEEMKEVSQYHIGNSFSSFNQDKKNEKKFSDHHELFVLVQQESDTCLQS